MVNSATADAKGEDYVTFAEAKGLSDRTLFVD